jgi:hypothetical protein
MTTVDLEIECSGEMHHIRASSDGTLRILDHDEDMLRAFSAFGAHKPECMVAADSFERDPAFMLLEIVNLPKPVLGKVACDFLERHLDRYEAAAFGDTRPRNTLLTAYRYWDGEEVSSSTIDAVHKQAHAAFHDTHVFEADLPPSAVRDSLWRAQQIAEGVTYLADMVDSDSRNASRMRVVNLAAQAVIAARNAASSYSEFPKGVDEEAAWQLDHTLKAILSWQKTLPWPEVEPFKR